jgi:Ca2+-binding EF-hand superfamily protein
MRKPIWLTFYIFSNSQNISLADLESYKEAIMKIVDLNGDGKVSKEELALLLTPQ